MSGIAGLYRLVAGDPVAADLERMTAALAHRGPDGSGAWSQDAVGLGHRMLWTTPESRTEPLPLSAREGALAITADARLDNRAELRVALGLDDREVGDAALILRAYERWGEQCPERLLGDFAFVIWDGRRRALFCVRDHFGVKPFYYHRAPRLFAFASEIKALLRLPEVPRRLNETRVADYLAPIVEDREITFYDGILRLPPAHTLRVSPEGAEVRCYWTLDSSREVRLGSDEEYAEAFRELFVDAVRCRMRTAGPVGSMLSGGLDSSSIVCVARALAAAGDGGPLHTFSAIFPDVPSCDERPFIDAVLAGNGVVPHAVRGDLVSPLADLERVLRHEDEAFFAPNLFIHWALYAAAEQQGVRVVLDGFDGDTTLWPSLTYLSELARAHRWRALVSEARGLSKSLNRPAWRFLLAGVRPLAPEPARRAWRSLRRRPAFTLTPTIRPEFARRIGLEARAATLLADRRVARTSRHEHWIRITAGLFPTVLEEVDRAAAAFSLEPRYPFFDRRLLEFCLALPAEQKLFRGWTRIVMRRAMGDLLPTEVRWRGKANLSEVLTRGLRVFEQDRLGNLVRNPGVLEEYVTIASLRDAYQRYTCGGVQEPNLAVWRASVLALWLRSASLAP
jgi:asparagine synthase (glutamine-hydrolysing)